MREVLKNFGMKHGRTIFILALILVLGLALRLYHLGTESLWLDEGTSLFLARWNLSDLIRHPPGDQLPLFMVILHYWTAIFGYSEISGRMIPALCGWLSVYLIYRAGSRLFDGSTGLLAAFFLALSPLHVYYSQEARMYSLHILLALASMLCFLNLMRTAGVVTSAAYLAATLLLLYSQSLAPIIVAVQNIFFFTRFAIRDEAGRLSLKRWCLLQFILLLLFAPGIYYVSVRYLLIRREFWIGPPTLATLGTAAVDYSGWSIAWVIFIPLIILGLASPCLSRCKWKVALFRPSGGFRMKPDRNVGWETALCGLWLMAPVLAPFFFSLLVTPIFITRITLGALPAFCILSARGVTVLKPFCLKASLVAVIAVLSSSALWDYYRFPYKEPWREAVGLMNQQAREGDLLIFHIKDYQKTVFDHYSRTAGVIKACFPSTGVAVTRDNIGQFPQLVKDRRRVWLVLCQSHDYQGLMKQELSRTYDLRNRKVYPYYNILARGMMDIEVCFFEKRRDN